MIWLPRNVWSYIVDTGKWPMDMEWFYKHAGIPWVRF